MRRVSWAGAIVLALFMVSTATGQAEAPPQAKNCEELKAEIAAKLDAKGVKNYTLEIVSPESVGDAKVVGSCGGGTKRITYKRN